MTFLASLFKFLDSCELGTFLVSCNRYKERRCPKVHGRVQKNTKTAKGTRNIHLICFCITKIPIYKYKIKKYVFIGFLWCLLLFCCCFFCFFLAEFRNEIQLVHSIKGKQLGVGPWNVYVSGQTKSNETNFANVWYVYIYAQTVCFRLRLWSDTFRLLLYF